MVERFGVEVNHYRSTFFIQTFFNEQQLQHNETEMKNKTREKENENSQDSYESSSRNGGNLFDVECSGYPARAGTVGYTVSPGLFQ